MKVFIIIMLSFAILQSMVRIADKVSDENAPGAIANIILFIAYILALIFACLI